MTVYLLRNAANHEKQIEAISQKFTSAKVSYYNFQIAGRNSEILINSFNSINRSNLSSFLFD